ncbi:MAG TPA: O-antigen ligase family protein [Gemmatimonadaceae bacterium]
MIASTEDAPGPSSSRSGRRYVSLRRPLLWQLGACVVPAMGLVAVGAPQMGAYLLFGALGIALVANHALGRQLSALALTVAALPAIMLLRDLVLYNSVVILLAGNIVLLLARSPAHAAIFRRSGLPWICYGAALYWLLSFGATGDYYANLRLLELVGSAATVVLLSRHRVYLATALYGLLGSLAVIGAALLPTGDRLGYARIGGVLLGNPIAFGLPLALLLVLAMADDGRWLLLQRNATLRLLVVSFVGVMLLLSTSRGSWLVAAAGVFAIVVLNRSSRRVALAGLVAMTIGGALAMQTSRGQDVSMWLDRTFSDDRSLGNRTSGRSDQWLLFPAVMASAPPWGYGPGTGKLVYARFSALDPRIHLKPGMAFDWHSLYLQIGVETGLVGITVLLVGFAALGWRGWRHWAATGDVTPIVGTLGFFLIGLTVSGMDAASGLYLGFAMLAGRAWTARARRRGARRRRPLPRGVEPEGALPARGAAP